MQVTDSVPHRFAWRVGLAASALIAATGCSTVTKDDDGLDYTPQRMSLEDAKNSADALKEAMDRLQRELPKHGWKAYRYGEANSKARQLRLEVEDKKEHHTVTIELSLPSTYPNPSKWEKKMRDSISISLASPCYVDKAYKPHDQ
ncbi:hypothetical protein ACIQPP_00025 [Streptomyces violaceusniger]|uniref:hypothetical protein n=1 Tax=Streptomyces violaceusniger TaxID=68280 RepID=UPI00131AF19C|nr:hypothetical protein [Streptomyces hygroscopicus]